MLALTSILLFGLRYFLAQGLIFHRVPPGQSKGPIQGAPPQPWYSDSTDSKLHPCELYTVNFGAALLGQILVCKTTTRKQYRVRRSVLIAVN